MLDLLCELGLHRWTRWRLSLFWFPKMERHCHRCHEIEVKAP